eukprot:31232-Pelagococcus_subviridis.AAC.9
MRSRQKPVDQRRRILVRAVRPRRRRVKHRHGGVVRRPRRAPQGSREERARVRGGPGPSRLSRRARRGRRRRGRGRGRGRRRRRRRARGRRVRRARSALVRGDVSSPALVFVSVVVVVVVVVLAPRRDAPRARARPLQHHRRHRLQQHERDASERGRRRADRVRLMKVAVLLPERLRPEPGSERVVPQPREETDLLLVPDDGSRAHEPPRGVEHRVAQHLGPRGEGGIHGGGGT